MELPRLSRRGMLRLGAAGAAAALITPLPSPTAGAAAALADQCGAPPVYPHADLLGVPLYYEKFLTPYLFYVEQTFYTRLELWWRHWIVNVPSTWTPAAIYSDGTYIDGDCGSEHGYGRAIDLTRIYINGTGRGFNGRYDLWSKHTGANLIRARQRYWAGVASLQNYFAPVITHPYVNGPSEKNPGQQTHLDHVHVDTTQLPASGDSAFTNSITQRQYLASALVYVWGYTGHGITTESSWEFMAPYAHDALWRTGVDGQITTQTLWWRFNAATTSLGTGEAWY